MAWEKQCCKLQYCVYVTTENERIANCAGWHQDVLLTSLKVSYSTRLRGIKVELQLVQVHILLLGTPVAIHSLSTNELTNYFSEATWSYAVSNNVMCMHLADSALHNNMLLI